MSSPKMTVDEKATISLRARTQPLSDFACSIANIATPMKEPTQTAARMKSTCTDRLGQCLNGQI